MSPDFLKPRQSTHRYPTDFLLGDLLVKAGIVSQKQLDDAVNHAGGKHLNVGQTLIVARYITARDLQAAVDAQSALRDRVVDMNTAIKGLKAACRAGIPFSEAVRTQDPGATKSIPTNKLGELLLEANIIDGDQFGKALQRSLATGLPLGRILVLNGAISETLLTTALEIQVRVRDDMLTRQEAIDYLKVTANQSLEEGISPERTLKIQALLKAPRKTGIRLGELLVLARVLGETDVMNALELGLVNDQPIGQILVAQGFVSPDLLDSALRLQELVDSGHLDGTEAAERLSKIHEEGVTFTEVVGDIELVEEPRPVVNFQTMLTLGRVISEDDFQAAFDLALTSPQIVATVLLMSGYMDEPTTDATLKCHSMILDGYLSQEDALVALDYCLQKMSERPISYEEALQELGWSLPPELLTNIGLASLRPQAEPIMNFAVEQAEASAIDSQATIEGAAPEAPPVESLYDNRNGDEVAAVDDHIGGYDTANGAISEAEGTAQSPQEEHFQEPEPMVEAGSDWSLPESVPAPNQSRSDFSVSLVSEEVTIMEAAGDVQADSPALDLQAVAPAADQAKRGVSLNHMKESARQLSQNRVSQSNVLDSPARPGSQDANQAVAQESGQGIGAEPVTAPAEEPQSTAAVTSSGSFKRKSSLKSLLAPGGNPEQSPAPPKPHVRDFAEATIDPDSAIAALPVGSLKSAKAPELELSEEEQAIIARASSLSATIEDMEAAARIVGKKQEVLRTGSGVVSDHKHDAEIAEMKKKIPESEFSWSPEVEEQQSEPEAPEIEPPGEPVLDKSQNGGLGSFLARAKGDASKSGKAKAPASGLGAHLGGAKQRGGVIGEALSKAKFEDSGLSAHLNKPKSRNAGLGTLLGKPKGEKNGNDKHSQSGDSVPALVTSQSEGDRAALAAQSQAITVETPEATAPAALEEITNAIAPGLTEEKPFVLNDSLIRLAESYYEQGKYTDAENLYNRILNLREAEAGPLDPNLVGDLNNLAGVLCVQGKFQTAEPLVERAVEMIEKLEPGDSLKLADSLNTLAGIYYQQDKYDQCETLLSRALNIRQKLLGEDHQDVADNLRDYAKFLRKINRPEEAEKLYTQAKEIVARAHKRKHSQSDAGR
ncbi:MAG: hypothetical protein C5B53_05870 [Candidatus Melainabacteria bacterium]|nr:MAG: hypothetical protein C5B53_05870 [Candidatus Melainabacteria bacterium]